MAKANRATSRVLLFSAALMAAGCASPGADDTGSDLDDELFTEKAQNATLPLVEIVGQTFVLSNLEAALVVTQVMPEMQSPPYTFFTPWNPAFNQLPYWRKITRDRAWWGHLRNLVRGHIHEGNISTAALKSSETASMLNGETANIDNGGTRPRVDGARVIASTAASDGHAHMLDKVREPKWAQRTILDIVNSDERFQVLAEILNHPSMNAKRMELDSAAVGLTLFAPTDEALAGFNLEQCVEPACADTLDRLIGSHLVGQVVSRRFTPTRQLDTHSGVRLNWRSDTQSVTSATADQAVQKAVLDGFEEELAINGIVHPIEVLLGGPWPVDDDDDAFTCDIQCGPGSVLSSTCQPSMTTRDESECSEQRAACCVEDPQGCATFCAVGQEFLSNGTLRGRTCGDMLAEAEPGTVACNNPGLDVRYACCRNTVVPQPVASSPCYDFCGDTRQLVGSRIVPDGTATCWDYSLSISASSAMCTSPNAAIQNACCGELRPPKPERFNLCCLCEGCGGKYAGTDHVATRADYPIGPEPRNTCAGVDSEMSRLPRDGEACNARKEAFRSTCCDPSYEPPPPVRNEVEEVPPCVGPNPPGYCNSSYPSCDLCKNGSYPKLPNTITALPYVQGNPKCKDLYWWGREGALPADYCAPIQNLMEKDCGCN